MTLTAVSPPYVDLAMGMDWVVEVEASALPTLTVILPDGTTLAPPVAFSLADGGSWVGSGYTARIPLQAAGRHIALTSLAGDNAVVLQAFATEITQNVDLPDAAELSAFLGGDENHSWSEDELTHALGVESTAQRRRCRIPAAYPDDLREALLRRAARNLDIRKQLTEMPRSDGEFTLPNIVPPGRDQEIRRLESPFFKMPIG